MVLPPSVSLQLRPPLWGHDGDADAMQRLEAAYLGCCPESAMEILAFWMAARAQWDATTALAKQAAQGNALVQDLLHRVGWLEAALKAREVTLGRIEAALAVQKTDAAVVAFEGREDG